MIIFYVFKIKVNHIFLTFKWNIYFWLWKGKNPDRICSKWKIKGSFRNVQIVTINLALQTTLFVWVIVKQSINTNKVFTSNKYVSSFIENKFATDEWVVTFTLLFNNMFQYVFFTGIAQLENLWFSFLILRIRNVLD